MTLSLVVRACSLNDWKPELWPEGHWCLPEDSSGLSGLKDQFLIAVWSRSSNHNVWGQYELKACLVCLWFWCPVKRKAILMVIEPGSSASQAGGSLQLNLPSVHLNVFWISSLGNWHVALTMSKIRLVTFPHTTSPDSPFHLSGLATAFPTC